MNALILVDLQNDFVPGGTLPVPDGNAVVPIANKLLTSKRFDLVVATQDWHPDCHGSFAAAHPGHSVGDVITLNGLPQVLWPVHCVQGSRGADFLPGLDRSRVEHVFQKGTDAAIDSYSGLFDNRRRKSTGLGEWLKEQGVKEIFVSGLTIEYCVKFTALDAVGLGFKVHLIEDASRGVNLQPGDVQRAVAEMREKGVEITTSEAYLR